MNLNDQPGFIYSQPDPTSPVPLYHQVYLDLRNAIQNGDLQPGAMLPPEVEICQSYNVGRQTIRKAIARLVDEDLVERFPGRGSYVRERPRHIQFLLDRSFSQQMLELGIVPQSRLISREVGRVTSQAGVLRPYHGQPCLLLERLRLGNSEPVCHQLSTILISRCPNLPDEDIAGQSLYDTLANRYKLAIQRIDHIVRAVAADEYHADLLDVLENTPLLFVATSAYLADGELIEFSTSYYRADRYEYSTTQTIAR